jgi:hypothetical protein
MPIEKDKPLEKPKGISSKMSQNSKNLLVDKPLNE